MCVEIYALGKTDTRASMNSCKFNMRSRVLEHHLKLSVTCPDGSIRDTGLGGDLSLCDLPA